MGLVTYDGISFPQGDPIVSLGKSFIESAGTPDAGVDSITLEGVFDKCDTGIQPAAFLDSTFDKDFKELVVDGTTWDCARVTSMSYGGDSEYSYIPYTVELEAYSSLSSFTQANKVIDASSSFSYQQGKDGITELTHSVSAKGIKTSATDDPFNNARDFCESLKDVGGGRAAGAGGGNVAGQNPVGGAGAPQPFFSNIGTTNTMLYNTSQSFDRIAGTYSIECQYRIGNPASYTTSISTELKKKTTQIQGEIFAAGGVTGALNLYKSVAGGYPNKTDENVTQDALWGSVSFSFSVPSNNEPRVLIDLQGSVNEGSDSSLVSAQVTIGGVPTAGDVTFKELQNAVDGASPFAYADELYKLWADENKDEPGFRTLKSEAISESTASSVSAMQYSKTYTYNNRGDKYSNGTQGTSNFSVKGSVPVIAEQAGPGGFIYTSVGYYTLADYRANVTSNCGSAGGTSIFPQYVTVNPNNVSASSSTISSSEHGKANSWTQQIKYDAEKRLTDIDTPATIVTLDLRDPSPA
jgi:hypothetical protein